MDMGYILMAATRYQLPRQTYGSSIVTEALIEYAPQLNDGDRHILTKEIIEAITTNKVSKIDEPVWYNAVKALHMNMEEK